MIRLRSLLCAMAGTISLCLSPLIPGAAAPAQVHAPMQPQENTVNTQPQQTQEDPTNGKTIYAPGRHSFAGNDGKSHKVSFDKNSFMVDGQRLALWSAELHYWRLPDTNGWRDILQKMKANGYNAVSLYFFWGMHQSSPGGAFDFSKNTIKDLDLLLTMAEEEGLYVIARPGPYVNAEASMGGLPAYMTNFKDKLRSTDRDALAASKEWLEAFNQIAKKHLITNGGGSILLYQVENELINQDSAREAFLTELVKKVRADGIDVPLFHNDYSLAGRFKDARKYGLDFYAYDAYPVGFNCSAPRNEIGDSEEVFHQFAPNSPNFITESQGGAFTPWGASYNASDCYEYTDEAFTRQWAVNNIGNGVTAFNFYMAFGGTNWGWTGSPSSGFTSYDYGAGITEDRVLTPKAAVQKEAGYYMQAVPEFAAMNRNSAPKVNISKGSPVRMYARSNDGEGSVTGNGVRSYAMRLQSSNDTTETAFTTSLVLDRAEDAQQAQQFSHDDRDKAVSYEGAWEEVADDAAFHRTLTESKTPGDSAKFTFKGSSIKLITSTATNFAPFTVQVDGGEPQTVTSARVDTNQNKPTQFLAWEANGLDSGEHSLVVTHAGNSGEVLSIDAFDIGSQSKSMPVEVNDSDKSFFNYEGAWEHAKNQAWTAADKEADETFSSTLGDTVSFKFTGVGFDLVGPYSENHGSATVKVDGEVVGQTHEEVTNSPQPGKVLFSWREGGSDEAANEASPSEHVVTVTVDGKAFEGSSGEFVSLDYVRYFPEGAALDPAVDDGPAEGEIGWKRIPQKENTFLKIHGRDALLLTADKVVAGHDLYYTTSQLFAAPVQTEQANIQYLVGAHGDDGETVLHYYKEPRVSAPDGVESHWDAASGQLRLNYTHESNAKSITISADGKPLTLRVIDRETAVTTWIIPTLKDGNTVNVAVEGVELARTATTSDSTLQLTGSVSTAATVRVWAPQGINAAVWNGAKLPVNSSDGSFTGSLAAPQAVTVPKLQFTSATDNAQAGLDYDDTSWKTAADKQAANASQGPGTHAGVVLDSNHYEFYEGSVWYRAHYTSPVSDPTLRLWGNGGSGVPVQGKNPAFMQVWVNGQYAGAVRADGSEQSIKAPAGSVKAGGKVVVAVLVHNLGQNLDWSDDGLSKQNRGLFDADLQAAGPVVWKVQGMGVNQGLSTELNPSGTIYNTGGLGGEHAGWHMPGFDDAAWTKADSLHTKAGVTWYRAHFDLDTPVAQDTAYRLEINSERFANKDDRSQVTLFVNGWNTGVYIGDVGPQRSFTIPSAFLNQRGKNVLAVAVAAKADGMGPESISLKAVHSTTIADPSTQNPADTPSANPSDTPGGSSGGEQSTPGGSNAGKHHASSNAGKHHATSNANAKHGKKHLSVTGSDIAPWLIVGAACCLGGIAITLIRRHS